ncbi:Protein OS-9 [Puccinia graminis f. sp. tritici]|uniref:Protein OS-9 homolog n=3 Tax=Puccinia graminis f. sp. tritici TaxID=56615 RepID=A0A5B0NPZ3_PUCGR|nr:Protein OS-9 [Puccinia graminis f. sp. tritici]
MNRRNVSPCQTLLLLLHLFQHASSLSSHSPPDPLAYPKYSVSLTGWDDAINNHTATAILSNLQSESKDDAVSILNYNSFSQNDQAELRHTLMRTASGQAFLCALPPIPPSASSKTAATPKSNLPDLPSSDTEDLERKKQREKIEEEGLKNGLKLISSLKDRCIYTKLGWFTYSFCYGKGEIKQFHAIMVPGFNHPQEDPNQDVYVLGFHLDHPQNPHHQARLEGTLPAQSISAGEGELTSLGRNRFASGGGSILGSISDVLRDESVIKSSVEKEEEEFQQKRYLVQRWDGGTTCDMTGKPRSVEVQFHCSTLGSDHIALLRETSICEYLLVIHTPRLCSEPLFRDGGARKGIGAGDMVANIGCRPVLTNEEIEKWKANEEARKKKDEEEKLKKSQSLDETPKENTKADESFTDSVKSTTSSEAPAESDTSNVPSHQEKLNESPDNEEQAPNSIPDQTVLSQNTDQATDGADSQQSANKEDSQKTTVKGETLEELEIDPITVYFDADTGKMYMDKSAADEARGRPSSTTADGKTQGTKSDSKTEGKNSPSDQANKDSNELEEIAKALKESLGALLRDLRGDDEGNAGRRLNTNRVNQRPRSLAEVLASFKSGDLPLGTKAKLKNQKFTDGHPPAQTTEDIKKLSSESHSKLVEMYQQKFNIQSDNQPVPNNKETQEDSNKEEDKN